MKNYQVYHQLRKLDFRSSSDKYHYDVFYRGTLVDKLILNEEETLIEGVLRWLASYCPVLDYQEREYLKSFLKPFTDKVLLIAKYEWDDDEEFIYIFFKGGSEISLPPFKAGTMYKGMMLNREYNLKQLGIIYEK